MEKEELAAQVEKVLGNSGSVTKVYSCIRL